MNTLGSITVTMYQDLKKGSCTFVCIRITRGADMPELFGSSIDKNDN